MNITQERYSLVELWLESFKVVNRCTGKLILLILSALFLSGVFFTGMFFLDKTIHGIAFKLIFGLVAALLWWLIVTVFYKLIDAQVQQRNLPFYTLFSESIWPTLYAIVTSLFFIGLGAAVFLFFSLLPGGIVLVAPIVLIFIFTIGIRIAYFPYAIAIKNQGPIECFKYSWSLTNGNYLDTLLMCIMYVVTGWLFQIVYYAIFSTFKIIIPLHFANSFNLAHLSPIWWLVGILIAIVIFFLMIVQNTFPVLVFLNRSAEAFGDMRNFNNTEFVPLPALELPDIHPNPNPEHMQQAESTIRTPILTDDDLRPMQEEVPPTAPVAAPTPQPASKPAVPPAANPQPQNMPSLEGLGVSKSSINTSEEDTNKLSEHLDQVYKPKPEDIVQYGDEDRMPTILFDDDMAKQLQANQAQYAPKPKEENKDKKDNGPDAIKMSKF